MSTSPIWKPRSFICFKDWPLGRTFCDVTERWRRIYNSHGSRLVQIPMHGCQALYICHRQLRIFPTDTLLHFCLYLLSSTLPTSWILILPFPTHSFPCRPVNDVRTLPPAALPNSSVWLTAVFLKMFRPLKLLAIVSKMLEFQRNSKILELQIFLTSTAVALGFSDKNHGLLTYTQTVLGVSSSILNYFGACFLSLAVFLCDAPKSVHASGNKAQLHHNSSATFGTAHPSTLCAAGHPSPLRSYWKISTLVLNRTSASYIINEDDCGLPRSVLAKHVFFTLFIIEVYNYPIWCRMHTNWWDSQTLNLANQFFLQMKADLVKR